MNKQTKYTNIWYKVGHYYLCEIFKAGTFVCSTLISACDYDYCKNYRWRPHHAGRYVIANIRQKNKNGEVINNPVELHRHLYPYTTHQFVCDHKNRDGLCNTRENLRIVPAVINFKNSDQYDAAQVRRTARLAARTRRSPRTGSLFWRASHNRWQVGWKAVHIASVKTKAEAELILKCLQKQYDEPFAKYKISKKNWKCFSTTIA